MGKTIKCFFEGQVHCYFELGGRDDLDHLACHGPPSYDVVDCFQIDARCLPDQSLTSGPEETGMKILE